MAIIRCKNCGRYKVDDIQQRPLTLGFNICDVCKSSWFEYVRPGFELTEEERKENAKTRSEYESFKKR